MYIVLNPSRKRNVRDKIVRPSVAVAIRTTLGLGNDATRLRKCGPRLAEAYPPQGWMIVDDHEPDEKGGTRCPEAMTGDDAGLFGKFWFEFSPQLLEALEEPRVNRTKLAVI
jgi:hypothetical protein